MKSLLKTLTIAGLAITLMLLVGGCGPSKEQLRLKAQRDAKAQATATLVEIRQAQNGTAAAELAAKLIADLKSAGEGLGLIPVEKSELDRIVADKYYLDAKARIAVLRDKKTGFEAARKARTEFYRMQEASGRPLAAFGVTAKGLSALVAAANRRAPAKKRPTKQS